MRHTKYSQIRKTSLRQLSRIAIAKRHARQGLLPLHVVQSRFVSADIFYFNLKRKWLSIKVIDGCEFVRLKKGIDFFGRSQPTDATPGSKRKVEVLAERVELGQELWNALDNEKSDGQPKKNKKDMKVDRDLAERARQLRSSGVCRVSIAERLGMSKTAVNLVVAGMEDQNLSNVESWLLLGERLFLQELELTHSISKARRRINSAVSLNRLRTKFGMTTDSVPEFLKHWRALKCQSLTDHSCVAQTVTEISSGENVAKKPELEVNVKQKIEANDVLQSLRSVIDNKAENLTAIDAKIDELNQELAQWRQVRNVIIGMSSISRAPKRTVAEVEASVVEAITVAGEPQSVQQIEETTGIGRSVIGRVASNSAKLKRVGGLIGLAEVA